MMKTPGHDELLSAFHDGELSAAERAEVERRLAESEALRGELGSLSLLSARLADLADALPEFDLRGRVMGAIASQSLRPVVAAPSFGSATGRSRRIAPWLWTVAGLGLAALVTLPLMNGPDRADVALNEKPQGPSLESTTDGALVVAPAPAPAAAVMAGPGLGDEVGMAGSAPSLVTADAPSEPAPEAAFALADAEDTIDAAELAELADLKELITKIQRQRSLAPGEMLARLEADGPVPMLFDYQVVDVARVSNDIQILLQKIGVETLPSEANDKKSEAPRKDSDEGELRMIYVAATPMALNYTIEVSNQGILDNGLGQVFAISGSETEVANDQSAVALPRSMTKFDEAASRRMNNNEFSKDSSKAKAIDSPHESPTETDANLYLTNGICVELNDAPQVYAELTQRQSGAYNNTRAPSQAAKKQVTDPAPAAPLLKNSLELPSSRSVYNGPLNTQQLQNFNSPQRKLQRALLVVRSNAAPPAGAPPAESGEAPGESKSE